MTTEDYQKHNQWLSETPYMKAGNYFTLIPRHMADLLVSMGKWDEWKNSVYVDLPLKVTIGSTK